MIHYEQGAAANLAKLNRRSGWRAPLGKEYVVLKLKEDSLLSYIRLDNKSVSNLSISVAMKDIAIDYVKGSILIQYEVLSKTELQ